MTLSSDRWLGRLAKICVLVAALIAVSGAVTQGVNTVSLANTTKIRVDSVVARIAENESALEAVSYMTCVNFAETHDATLVPTYCSQSRHR